MATNPYYTDTKFQCHFDGTNGSTTFTDVSNVVNTLGANGDAALSTAQSKFGTASLYLDGSGDYVAITPSDSSLTSLSAFTIEFFVRPATSGTNYPTIIGTRSGWSAGSFTIRHNNTGLSNKFSVHWNGATPADPFISSTNTFAMDAWYHVAVVRSGSTVKLYVDGVEEASGTYATALNLAYGSFIDIGRSSWDGAGGFFKGYIDEIRIANVAIYTSAFTPPASAFLDYSAQVTGNISESSDITDWRITAYKCADGTYVGTSVATGTTYSMNVFTLDPCNRVIAPKIDYAWATGRTAAVGEFCIPSNPETTPHLFKCTTGGAVGGSEPSWNLSGTTSDNSAVWTYVAPLVDPAAIGPKIPT